jgi:hypothetical protein
MAEAETFKIFITEEGTEKDLTREDIVEILYNDVATVTFTKADGTERVMECTLLTSILEKEMPDLSAGQGGEKWFEPTLPDGDVEEEFKKAVEKRYKNPNTVAVWDIPSVGWRSFRVDSVKSISIPAPTNQTRKYPTPNA